MPARDPASPVIWWFWRSAGTMSSGGEFDAHGMDPVAVLGGTPGPWRASCRRPIWWAAAQPSLTEGIGLTPAVQDAVPAAAAAVRRLVSQLIDDPHSVGERV